MFSKKQTYETSSSRQRIVFWYAFSIFFKPSSEARQNTDLRTEQLLF